MVEEDIRPELVAIRGRVRRGDMVRTLSTDIAPDPLDHLWRMVTNKPTSVARSEISVSPAEIEVIQSEVGFIREWLLLNGELGNREDGSSYRFHKTGIFEEVWADESDVLGSEDPKPSKVELIIEDAEMGIKETVVFFGFEDDFRLEVTFADRDEPTKKGEIYDSARRPLQEMTEEELRIIRHYLDQYCAEAGIAF